MPDVPMLVVTGPVGVGKTTVATAASELLDAAGTPHALVDADWLRWLYPRSPRDPFRTTLGLRNLAAVWSNYDAAGAERLILVDVVESREEVSTYRSAVPGADVTVARLRAPLPTIVRRLEGRETGENLSWHLRRAAELSDLMERRQIGDLLLDTEDKPAAGLARELLDLVRWM